MTEHRNRAMGPTRALRIVPAALAVAGLLVSMLTAEAAAAGPTIEIRDFWFYPPAVQITTGQSVTWTNVGDVVHDVSPLDGGFRASPPIKPGKHFTARFLKPGTYRFVDSTYPGFMTGTVVVTGKPVTVAAAATPKPAAKPPAAVKATPKPATAPDSPADAPSTGASPSPTDVLTGAAGGAGGAGGPAGSGGSGSAGGSGGSDGSGKGTAGLPGTSDSPGGFIGLLGVLLLAGLIGLLLAGWVYLGRSRSPLEPAPAAAEDVGPAPAAVPSATPAPARLPRWIERNQGVNPYTANVTARSAATATPGADPSRSVPGEIPPGFDATAAAVGGDRGLWTEDWDPVRPAPPDLPSELDDPGDGR